MEILSPGVLLNLLEQKTSDETPSSLLQIRSIVPAFSETDNNEDLFPKHGFYLKVADSSHAMYVSLPREQQDMVLGDQLQLGQLIFAEKIEKSDHGVPVIRGIRPVPGRHACVGDPEDLVDSFSGLGLGVVVSEKKKPSTLCFSPLRGSRKNSRVSLPLFSTPTMAKRRSWIGDVEVSSGCSVSKVGTKPVSRRKSACASSNLYPKYDLLNDNSSSVTKKKSKPLKETSNEWMKNCDKSLDQAVKLSPVGDRELVELESKTLSNSLPRNLVKLGKEVEKSRDLALLASIEALQEASASERLLKCLVEFSKLKTTTEKEKHPSLADAFFKLQQDLAQTGQILQSLTNSSDQNSHKCTRKMASKLFADRNKVASSWISAALASDLDPLSVPSLSSEAANSANRLRANLGGKTRDTISKGNSEHWIKGSAFCASLELANSLHNESKLWFLGYAEMYLDELSKSDKNGSLEPSDSEVAEMMCRIKKFSDWLDSIDVVSFAENDSEVVEACGRLKNKIYGVLLNMAERTALAWGHMKTMVEEVKQQ